jgi:hypothetical protein
MSSKSFQNASKLCNIVVPGQNTTAAPTVGFYFNPLVAESVYTGILGTSSAPIATNGTPASFAKYSSRGDVSGTQNPACFAVGYKTATSANSRVQGFYGEAIDSAGGVGSFVEGGRFAGINVTSALKGDVYGLIALAQSGDTTHTPASDYVIGCESEVITYNGDAPAPVLFNINKISSSFNATARLGNRPDAAFLVNPFNTTASAPQCGFMVGPGQQGIGTKSVNHTAFGCYQTGLQYGLDLSVGSYAQAAVLLPNNSVIRWRNAAGNAELNSLFVGTDNKMYIGFDLDTVVVSKPLWYDNQDTSPTAGAIAGYVVTYINGTQRKIPYYAV